MNAPSSAAWITGAGGLIGSHFLRAGAPPGWVLRPLSRLELDLTDPRRVAALFQKEKPGLVIHCAAITKPAACQADPPRAHQLNVEATRFLAELAAGIPFLFFSSDIVFNGKQGPYRETDPVSPLNVYGETKAAAERIVLQNPRHIVIRTSLNGGRSPTRDRGFSDELRRAWMEGRIPSLFTDEFRSPLAASVTVAAIWELLRSRRAGLFHLAGAERLSRYQIGELLASLWPELRPRITPGLLRNYQGPPRAPDTTLDCQKIQQLLSFPLPGLSEWIRSHPADF